MSKSKKEEEKKEEESNNPVVDKVADRANIVQPDPNNEDSQFHIHENAKKGEAIPVPNTIGPNPINVPLK